MTAIELRLFVSAVVALVAAIAWVGVLERSRVRDARLRARFGTTIPTASAIPTAFRKRSKGGRA